MKTILRLLLIVCAVSIVRYGIYAIKSKVPEKSGSDAPDSTQGDILKIRENDNIKGDKNAPMTIVDYSDYQCPYCIKYDETISKVLEAYPGKVRLVYRHFPLPFHKAAKSAAVAAEAAGGQGKYWEFHDKLVANSKPDGEGLQSDDLLRYAVELGLDMDKFQKDLLEEKYVSKVVSDEKEGISLKIKGTPASFLIDEDGRITSLEGALSFDQLKSKIDTALAK